MLDKEIYKIKIHLECQIKKKMSKNKKRNEENNMFWSKTLLVRSLTMDVCSQASLILDDCF